MIEGSCESGIGNQTYAFNVENYIRRSLWNLKMTKDGSRMSQYKPTKACQI